MPADQAGRESTRRLAVKGCSVQGCARPYLAKDLCRLHYSRQRAGKAIGGPERLCVPNSQAPTCSEDGCEKRPQGRGLCPVHYARWHHRNYDKVTCQHPDGCDRPNEARGWCAFHDRRIKVTGKPGPALPFTSRRPYVPGRRAWTRVEQQRYYNYGVTPIDVERMLSGQGGRCYLCGGSDPGTNDWCVDHCHETGVARFILCTRCNLALGLVLEDPRVAWRLYEATIQCQEIKRGA